MLDFFDLRLWLKYFKVTIHSQDGETPNMEESGRWSSGCYFLIEPLYKPLSVLLSTMSIVSLFQIDSFIKDMLFFLVTQDAIAKTFIVMYHLFWFYLPVLGKSNLVTHHHLYFWALNTSSWSLLLFY